MSDMLNTRSVCIMVTVIVLMYIRNLCRKEGWRERERAYEMLCHLLVGGRSERKKRLKFVIF